MSTAPSHIIISRTDSIGDVMLTLPMCGRIKASWPSCKITFLGRAYTQGIIEACEHVDAYLNWDEMKTHAPAQQVETLEACETDAIIHVFPRKEILWLAKKARIPMRICTGHRLHALTKCNKLVFFSRKNSDLHEAQLNFKLLRPLGLSDEVTLAEIADLYGFTKANASLPAQVESMLQANSSKRQIIVHPLSKGSAAEWSLENYAELISRLPAENFHVYVTGTADEGERVRASISLQHHNTTDLTGRLSLPELIAFIGRCDALVAASTGPLHIAAATGIHAIGLFSPKRPIHPGRWSPIGKKAEVICAESHPKKGEQLSISPDQVQQAITRASK
jgi:ADP-heptose:LPS heptosyltransferase